MLIDQLFPSRYLRCADLNGQPARVIIDGLKREDIGGEFEGRPDVHERNEGDDFKQNKRPVRR